MKAPSARVSAFTLIELLVVIAIIAILAAMTLGAILKVKDKARIARAKMEMGDIQRAVHDYVGAYGPLPVSANVNVVAGISNDFTYGGSALNNVLGPGTPTPDNAEVMAIVMDLETYGNGTATLNKGHVKNPQQTKFLHALMVSDTTSAGVGTDGVFRDPWGNPYVISLDVNANGKCRDAFYALKAVSQSSGATGFNGLVNSVDAGGVGDNFQFNGAVMVWSFGPDKSASASQPANAGVNRDNILSWK